MHRRKWPATRMGPYHSI